MKRPDILALDAAHLPAATCLSSALGWPYRESDWKFALSLGTGLAMEHEGRLVATALWWPYGDTHASFGMIIVAPEMQGRGLGRAATIALLSETAGRTVVLNSTADGLSLYKQLGFITSGQVCQHQAILLALPPLSQADDTVVRPMKVEDRSAVHGLDALATAMDRSVLLDALAKEGPMVVCATGSELHGYACLRTFGHGIVIGPVVAKSLIQAQALIAALASRCQRLFVRIDVPEVSGLSSWLTDIGLPIVGYAAAMRRGPEAPFAEPQLFALANQSLG